MPNSLISFIATAERAGQVQTLHGQDAKGSQFASYVCGTIQQHRDHLKQLQMTKWELEALLSQGRIGWPDEETVKGYVEYLGELLSRSPLTERRAFIKSFVKEVKVTENDVLLTYTMPVSASGITQKGVAVLDTVQHGGQFKGYASAYSNSICPITSGFLDAALI